MDFIRPITAQTGLELLCYASLGLFIVLCWKLLSHVQPNVHVQHTEYAGYTEALET